MKKLLSITALVLSVNTFSAYMNARTIFNNTVTRQSVILPAYNYPDGKNDSYWNSVTAIGGSKIPYAIINPDNGSGEEAEYSYINQIAENKAAGIKNIGYIRTDYQNRSIAEVLAEVDNYYKLYGEENINGFFFDELAVGSSNNTNYMSEIYNYVKGKSTDKLVMGNPGKQINDGISPYADIFVTSEISADEYINRYTEPKSEFENNPQNAGHIMHIVYGAKPEQYDTIVKLSRERNAGWLMITDDRQPNPYDGLPADFTRLVNLINNLGNIPDPNTKGNTGNSGNSGRNLPGSSNGKQNLHIPRSKVDLDLVKSSKSTIYRSMENTGNGTLNFDATYIGNFGVKYKDKSGNLNYGSSSNGILLSIFKDYGKYTIGGGFGYQKSKIGYKEKFDGIKEEIDSYQLILGGKYNINDEVDLTGTLTYSGNTHEFKNKNGRVFMDKAKYNSQILDFDTRIGYKYSFSNGYVKPYAGIGVTNVREGAVSKINAGKTSRTGINSILGVYAKMDFGQIGLFGNLEYEQRFGSKTYHGKRSLNNYYDVAALDYRGAALNLGAGMRYRITDALNILLGYELLETKNSVFKLGMEADF